MTLHRLCVSVFLLMVLGTASTALAQQSPQADTDILASVTVDTVPSPDSEIWFMRVILEPGGSLPLDRQIGPTLMVIESGSVILSADHDVNVTRAETAGTPGAAISEPGEDLELDPGDVALVADGTTLAARNDGTEPVSLLALLIIDPRREGEAAEPQGTATTEMVGATTQGLGVAGGEFQAGPAMLTIERVVLLSGERMPAGVSKGTDVGAVEQGSVEIALTSGYNWIWRGMMTTATDGGDDEGAAPMQESVDPGETAVLAAGDGYGLTGAVATWTSGGEGAIILRAIVEPIAGTEATPASQAMSSRSMLHLSVEELWQPHRS